MNQSKKSSLFIIVLLAISLTAPGIPIVKADGEAWLTGWNYRKQHTINGTTAGAQTDYQIKITAHYGVGSDSDDDVYLNSKCRADFGDIRFTNSSGQDLLDYWIEEKTDSDNAIFWVEVDSIPDDPEDVNIYIYYGKADETTTSNGYATFLFFDDFPGDSLNATKWPTVSGTPLVGSGELALNDNDNILSGTAFGYNIAIVAKSKADEQDIVFVSLSDENSISASNELRITNTDFNFPDDFDKYLSRSMKGGSANDVYFDTGLDFRNNYYLYQIRRIDGKATFYQESTLINTEINVLKLPTVNLYPHFGVWDSTQESTLTVDWVFVRKYVDPEPTHGAWGEEEIIPPSDPNLLFGAGFNASSPYVELHWNHSLVDVQFFEVQNSSDGESWTYLGQSTTANYTDTQVVKGTERYYKVRACNQTNEVWHNSSWTDVNFEKVHFILGVGDGDFVCVPEFFNASSIEVIAGTLNDGNLASTYFVDGDWYNVSEVTGPPGVDIRVNFTGVEPGCGCFEFFQTFTGHPHHDIEVQLWNFTSTSWTTIGPIFFNETANWACIGLGHNYTHFFDDGNFYARFYHEGVGHAGHEFHVDRIDLGLVQAEECAPAEGEPVDDYSIIFLAIGLIICLAIYFLYSRLK